MGEKGGKGVGFDCLTTGSSIKGVGWGECWDREREWAGWCWIGAWYLDGFNIKGSVWFVIFTRTNYVNYGFLRDEIWNSSKVSHVV